jgi:hypothetical protein
MSNLSSLLAPPLIIGVVCTPTEWNASGWSRSVQGWHNSSAQPTLLCLTRGQSLGLTLTTEAAFISLVTVIYVFALITASRTTKRGRSLAYTNSSARRCQTAKGSQGSTQFASLSCRYLHGMQMLSTPCASISFLLQLSLLATDLVQAVGTIMDIRWIHKGIVYVGGFCTAQDMHHVLFLRIVSKYILLGIVQQLGEMPVTATTLVTTFTYICWILLYSRQLEGYCCTYVPHCTVAEGYTFTRTCRNRCCCDLDLSCGVYRNWNSTKRLL